MTSLHINNARETVPHCHTTVPLAVNCTGNDNSRRSSCCQFPGNCSTSRPAYNDDEAVHDQEESYLYVRLYVV